MERRKGGMRVKKKEGDVLLENGSATHMEGNKWLGFRGDGKNIALLFFLYTLQGIPLGLSAAIPMILQNKGVTYKQQAEFSFVTWPFSLKLMWAPIVDSVFSQRLGRRKSWMVPTQYLIGLFMLLLSAHIDRWLGQHGEPINIGILTVLFFTLNFLAATQDIAVDGWALTMLQKRNIGHASTCNSCGQTAGYFLSFVIFMALESEDFCNRYLRAVPEVGGIITISSFLNFWGWVFLITTTLVALLKSEVEPVDPDQQETNVDVRTAYRSLIYILKLKPVQMLTFILLTCKIAFAPTESAMSLKLIEGGIPKEKLGLMVVPLIPVQILLPLVIARYTTGPRPLDVFVKAIPYRMLSVVCSAFIVWWTPVVVGPTGEMTILYMVILLAWYVLHQIALYCMFVSCMAFFAKISDASVGGTYMTLLNAICNLGGNWPATMALWFLDPLTFKNCVGGDNNLSNTCRDSIEEELCTKNGGTCNVTIDGYHLEIILSTNGGGCCDCGDKEAWRKAPFCDTHIIGTQEVDEVSRALPEDLAERTRIVFDAVLWYSYNLLTLEHTADLRLRDSEDDLFDMDTYCTILYNDEVHTFEQVIGTINRVIKCSQRTSIEYVTNIDREGRAVVKCSNFLHCNELKTEIEKITSRHGSKPLKVLVVHSHIVAHQIFAMKLLSWLQAFLGHGEGFRAIFAEVALKPQQSNPSIVKGILLRDSQLWKSARTHCHRLLISGMLLEYENKKALAKVFTKNYGTVMKDFIKDDHDHSFSVCSLAVQLFTVPTLAHHLIANNDALFILLNTFISECTRKCNAQGKLEFERSLTFKRAQYILYDLRYLLSAVPETWTDELRRSFLQGLFVLLDLLAMMEGMDSVTRQVGQHMEYEPEWESAFNLHIKLAYCISLVIKWCGTDKVVLVKAYRATLKKLLEHPCYDVNDKGEIKELRDFSIYCLQYDVATKPVSIHLPLSRFLAGLHLHLEKFGLSFSGSEFPAATKPTAVQIIEPVLRTQVMIAQVHAGMWRRNGYALLNQLYFYHNVKCRSEMLDRDITLLQIGASLIESDEFLIHLLNKFNLLNWANASFEGSNLKTREEEGMRQTQNLVEEFLQLLIVIIGERYIPGISNVTTDDRVKKEIIQHLCIKPLPHSELNKTIPDDLTHKTQLDEIIEKLAVFKKPSQSYGKGVYELKPEYFDDYNVFYYHYTREELSKSEEEQRQRRKNAGELECCPPPKLPELTPSFNMISNLLQCDVMLHIMQTVLSRAINLRSLSFSELQLHKVLHLIGYALQEEQSKRYPFLLFSEKATRWNVPSLLEELLKSSRVEAQKGLIKWTLNKFKQVTSASTMDVASTSMDLGAEKPVDGERERRARLAAERRAKIMAQMTQMQNTFLKENAQMFEEAMSEVSSKPSTETASMETNDVVVEEQPIALGPNQRGRISVEKEYTCILCQEEQKVTASGPTMVLAAFVQQSTVLCQHHNNEELMDVSTQDPLYLNSNLGPAPHTSTCGHVMHSACWQKYFDNVMMREHRRPYRQRHPASFDVDKQEFLCPLCECLSNTVLPLVPSLSLLHDSRQPNDVNFEQWLYALSVMLKRRAKKGDGCSSQHCNDCGAGCAADADYCFHDNERPVVFEGVPPELVDKFLSLFRMRTAELSQGLLEMIELFTQVTYTRGLNVNPHPTDRRLAPMAWKSCSYTIHSIETILRDTDKPLLGSLSSRHRDCLECLVRIMGVLGPVLGSKNVVVTGHTMRLLAILLEHPDDGPSVLEWDSLGVLVPLTFSLQNLLGKSGSIPIPTGGSLELHALQLVFTSHIVKILLTSDLSDLDAVMDTDENDDQLDAVFDVLKAANKYRPDLSARAVWEHVKSACAPFLRCCVLFYHYLTDVSAPAALTEVGGDTFKNMCCYLDLPQSPKQLFGSATVMELVAKWIRHPYVQKYQSGLPLLVIKEPVQINRLVDLPADYSELINTVSSFTCPNSDHEDSRNPTMCLVCGEVLCSQSYCCQTELNKTNIGACNFHAHKCGAGIGVFLRVRECEIMFLASPQRGCFVTPPYLDDYGETDQGLKRGNPLHLCPARYRKLQSQWLNHSIHEEIARFIESSNNVVPTQWQHL